MRINGIIASMLLPALTALAVAAVPADDPYGAGDGVVWKEYPSADVISPDKSKAGPAQTKTPTSLQAGYAESRDGYDRPSAMVNCQVERQAFLSLMYFSAKGRCYLQHAGLPVAPGQEVTLTLRLPRDDSKGVTCLLAWPTPPSSQMLLAIERQPNHNDALSMGAFAQHWFPRAKPGGGGLPWLDPMRGYEVYGIGLPNLIWPFCLARLDSFRALITKDCGISFSGMTDTVYGDSGPYGVWELSWSSPLVLIYEQPGSLPPPNQRLLIYGDQLSPLIGGATPVEIAINGWHMGGMGAGMGYQQAAQPFQVQLSPYTQQGENRIEVRLSALSSSTWQVRGIEVRTD